MTLSRLMALAGLALMAALSLGVYNSGYVWPWAWHQKVALTVQTPTGDVTGSAVQSVAWRANFFSGGWGGASYHQETVGEAVALEVGPGKYLFLLMAPGDGKGDTSAYMADLATQVLYETRGRVWGTKAFARVKTVKGEVLTVPAELYPMLVTFGDVARPESVMQVDPANLAASFGPGYALKAITLTITDEPVTKGTVEKVLPWYFDPKVMDNPGWAKLPLEAKKLIGGFVQGYEEYLAARERVMKGHNQ
jgi:hypothetical protein